MIPVYRALFITLQPLILVHELSRNGLRIRKLEIKFQDKKMYGIHVADQMIEQLKRGTCSNPL